MTDSVVGSAEFELRATRRQLPADLRKAEAEVDASLKKMEGSGNRAGEALDLGVGGGAKGAIGALGGLASVATIVVSALIAAAGAALKFGMDGMRMAGELDTLSGRIGVSTDALQEWRYVARQLGEDAGTADRALESFAEKFASATTGASPEAMRAFGALGFTQDQLRGIGDVEAALDVVVQRLSDMTNETDKFAVASRLGLGDFIAGLNDSESGIQALQVEAQRLGYVLDEEMVQRGAEAQREFEGLQDLIGIQLRQAFIDLAPAINAALTLALSVAEAIRRIADGLRSLDDRSTVGLQEELVSLEAENAAIYARARSNGRAGSPTPGQRGQGIDDEGLPVNPELRREAERNREERNRVSALLMGRDNRSSETPDRPPSTIDMSAPRTPRTPRTPRDTSAADARRALQAERRYEDLIRRAEEELAEALAGRADTAQERAALELDALAREQAQERVRIDRMREDGELTAVQHQELIAAQDRLRFARENAINDQLQADIAEERLEVDQALADLSAELIAVQASSAATLDERRRLEQDLLSIGQEQRRAALEALLASESITDARRAELRSILDRIEGAERTALDRQNAGPLQQWRRAGEDLNTDLELVAADGLDALNEGLVDAIMNTEELGDVFKRVAMQIVQDLLRIVVRRGITEPLANAVLSMLPGGGEAATEGAAQGSAIGAAATPKIVSAGAAAGDLMAAAIMTAGAETAAAIATAISAASAGSGKSGAGSAAGMALDLIRGGFGKGFGGYDVGAKGAGLSLPSFSGAKSFGGSFGSPTGLAAMPGKVVVEFREGPAFGGVVLEAVGPVIAQAAGLSAKSGAGMALQKAFSMNRNKLGV